MWKNHYTSWTDSLAQQNSHLFQFPLLTHTQATEAAVDLALALSVPFCVVPCCVFPAEFIERQNPDGTRLRTYQQLLAYLLRKSNNIHQADLNFPFTETSKNRVLYTLP